MTALFILIPVSITVAAGFLLAFIWSVRHHQFDDKKGSALRMLYDDTDNSTGRKI
jgi:cbb3-type cytochrome oxidase maturation protein